MPPPLSHYGGFVCHSGGLAAFVFDLHSRCFTSCISRRPRFFLLAPASPNGDPTFLPRRQPWRGLSWCRSCLTSPPLVVLPLRFLACPMATPSACLRYPLAPLQSSRPLPYLTPLDSPCSRHSTPCLRPRSPQGRPSRSASLCIRCYLPGILVPISCDLSPPSSSPVRLSSTPSLICRAAVLLCTRSSLPLQLFSPIPPAGPCSRSPHLMRSFPPPSRLYCL